MPLSAHERRALQAIESALTSQNPRLARRLSRFDKSSPAHRAALRAAAGLAAAALYALGTRLGNTLGTALAVVGYCLLAATIACTLPTP